MKTGPAFVLGYLAGAATAVLAYFAYKKIYLDDIETDDREVITFAEIRKQKETDVSNDADESDLELEELSQEIDDCVIENEIEDIQEEYKNGVGIAPYLISPEDFLDSYDDYEQTDLIYYADGVLCDDMDIPVENVRDTVGDAFPGYFGVWDDDEVHVRNDERKTDYVILRSLKTYEEVLKEKPYLS